jgi:Rieske Fe-S protein
MDQSRRQILKFIAGAPLVLTFGFAGEALLRFAKPSMKPFGVFDQSDQPSVALPVATFELRDFPQPWTCIPFMYQIKFAEFNPEQKVVRTIPGFLIRLSGDEIVAYSRICPRDGSILNYVPNARNCGCHPLKPLCCACAVEVDNPVLICPCDLSTYDLALNGRVIRGPGPRPPRKFQLDRQGDMISVVSLECGSIS